MSDISLLPQDFRDKEEEMKKTPSPVEKSGETLMHLPKEEAEDIEIIEVEEGEVDQVLMGEPLLSRLIYKTGVWMEKTRNSLFKTQKPEPPAKTPPQFFKPLGDRRTSQSSHVAVVARRTSAVEVQKTTLGVKDQGLKVNTGSVHQEAALTKPTGETELQARPKARIIPSSSSPRRVRIIKRVRKSVHVSLLDQDVLRQLRVNVPKRKLTLVFMTLLFVAVFVATYLLLGQQQAIAQVEKQNVEKEASDLRGQIGSLQEEWLSFSDLEVRLMLLNDLMNGHVSVLHALKLLEQKTLSDVSYGGFLMDNTGHINLSVSAPSYEAAARQLQIFKESPEVKTVEANAFTKIEGSSEKSAAVNFQLSMQLQNEALLFEKPKP